VDKQIAAVAKPTIVITGGKGLIGSVFVTEFADSFNFVHLDVSDPVHPVDITDQIAVIRAVEQSGAAAIVHLAAFTDVNAAWEQSGDTSGLAYRVNVTGTRNIAEAAKQLHIPLIHLSTAYVFDGKHTEPYPESAAPNPIEWYGQTKAMAEEVVQSMSSPWCILRIDQPFALSRPVRPDVVRRLSEKLLAGTAPPQFVDHTFGPTVIEDLAIVLAWVIQTSQVGLWHATANEQWTDFEFAKSAQAALNLPGIVHEGSLAAYLQSTNRPYQQNTALDSSRLHKAVPFTMRTVGTALASIEQ
jgi:dTDP-4-dehydrorhamnose reductase